MNPLRAAAKGARDFSKWAKRQGCDTKLLVDSTKSKVRLSDVFEAVTERVDARVYDQLIVYFSGHGILLAPESECWLLSGAPSNPNEAVNLSGSVAEARNAGIPHVIFVSDACRSSVAGPPLSAITGGVIFPNRGFGSADTEVDVLYAATPGNPAYEVPVAEAAKRWGGIFTNSLLAAVASPEPDWVEPLDDAGTRLEVVTTRTLRTHLAAIVPAELSAVSIKLIQEPVIRVETAWPKFFATVDSAAPPRAVRPNGQRRRRVSPEPPELRLSNLGDTSVSEISVGTAVGVTGQPELAFRSDIARLRQTRGRDHYETETGFTLFGVESAKADAKTWRAQVFREGPGQPIHVRLLPPAKPVRASSIVFEFDGKTGTALPVLRGLVGTVVVEDGRVTSVNYVPSSNNWRYQQYKNREEELERMKAVAAVAALNGSFVAADLPAGELARQIRTAKGIDPTMGLYAAYAYAQVGNYKEAYSVFRHMKRDEELPVPFDVVMLAGRFESAGGGGAHPLYAPFTPMLAQGWSLLTERDRLHKPIHQKLRRHLIPSLWTTFNKRGVVLARQEVLSGRAK